MKQYLKFPSESKLGIGNQYVELDSEGWAVRQVECYGSRLFNSEQINHAEIGGIALCDQQFLESHIESDYIISSEEFESVWESSIKDGSLSHNNSELSKSEYIYSPNRSVDRIAQVAITVPVRTGILTKLFPNVEERAIAQARLNLIKTDPEFLKEALIISRKTQIASLEEALNHYLIRKKIDARQEIYSYILEARKQLQEQLDITSDEFIRTMVAKLEDAQSIEHDFLRNVRLQQLEADLTDFLNLQQSLLEHFRRSFPENT